EGLLLGDDNIMVLDLLFDLATWHEFAKLHMHTEDALNFFDTATAVLGQTVHKFAHTTCKHYYMTELPHEYVTSTLASKFTEADPKSGIKAVPLGPKHKTLDLKTYKYHALGDYPDTIQQFGTTDSFSTQTV
ncbi:hypothetical protein BDR04DRAFT_981789, partial [Suillus decipiens]